jgi:asparagine synthase (glutamine-hydrolysing)
MCGINGFNWNDKTLVQSMCTAVKHRGPDDSGIYFDENISFGHVRLSIIDLSKKGHQPMGLNKDNEAIYEDAKLDTAELIIIFNGEIYNYQEIRSSLEKSGVKFQTGSDTEVILKSYRKWGAACVNRFNGMWSFSIYDKTKNLLFCSRDRLGVKPFYYYYDKKHFVFSSELKGILQTKSKDIKFVLNNDAIKFYFAIGYIPAPMSIYKNTFKLEAGHNLIFNLKTSSIKLTKYYEIPDFKPVNNKQQLISEGKEILYDATRLRMIADVPVGAFLSGGLDSSSIVGAMSKYTKLKNLHTFSIGFDKKYDKGKYDETKYVKIVKNYFKTNHHHYYFKEKDFEDTIKDYIEMYDEPFADYSGFPIYKVSKMARAKVTVALSGDGGDEIFGGYTSHLMGARLSLIRKTPRLLRKLGAIIPAKKNLNETASLYLLKEALALSLKDKKSFHSKTLPDESYKPEIFQKWSEYKLEYCLKKGNNNLSEALRIYDLLYNTLQDNFLVKVDRASMQAPIEVRSPFLDYRFIEFAQRIPSKWKVSPTKTKILMREIIKDIVPKEIINRGKQGFEPPLDKWILREKHMKYMEKRVNTLKDIDADLYDFYKNKVMKENNKFHNIYRIRLFLFLKWQDRWLKQIKQ